MHKTCSPINVDIYMAGDMQVAKQVCREFCRVGFCVTIESLDYIYTGGEESGFRVGIKSYPKFEAPYAQLYNGAVELANLLKDRLCQDSYMICSNDSHSWYTTRE